MPTPGKLTIAKAKRPVVLKVLLKRLWRLRRENRQLRAALAYENRLREDAEIEAAEILWHREQIDQKGRPA